MLFPTHLHTWNYPSTKTFCYLTQQQYLLRHPQCALLWSYGIYAGSSHVRQQHNLIYLFVIICFSANVALLYYTNDRSSRNSMKSTKYSAHDTVLVGLSRFSTLHNYKIGTRVDRLISFPGSVLMWCKSWNRKWKSAICWPNSTQTRILTQWHLLRPISIELQLFQQSFVANFKSSKSKSQNSPHVRRHCLTNTNILCLNLSSKPGSVGYVRQSGVLLVIQS